jgi:hypothetical protein
MHGDRIWSGFLPEPAVVKPNVPAAGNLHVRCMNKVRDAGRPQMREQAAIHWSDDVSASHQGEGDCQRLAGIIKQHSDWDRGIEVASYDVLRGRLNRFGKRLISENQIRLDDSRPMWRCLGPVEDFIDNMHALLATRRPDWVPIRLKSRFLFRGRRRHGPRLQGPQFFPQLGSSNRAQLVPRNSLKREQLIDRHRVPREQQTPDALAAYQKSEIAKWWPIINTAGIKVQQHLTRARAGASRLPPRYTCWPPLMWISAPFT